ncbi:MAG: hypothetical protein QOJ19_3285 [Acidimicrobiia bacterium]|nr:hypothetical protein [Acidimicrobiia bacterium]
MSDAERRLDGLPGPVRPRRPEDFDSLYEGTPAWDIGRPQPAFLELAESGQIRGLVLDVGCGTGEHALMAAGLGLDATGIDAAPSAIARAEGKARERCISARFLVWDALNLASLREHFDTVLDCGLFHVLEDDDRARYVESLQSVVLAGGTFHMLCFSNHQPGDWGPRRIAPEEITTSFSQGWRVDLIEPAKIEITINPEGAIAWHASITRV